MVSVLYLGFILSIGSAVAFSFSNIFVRKGATGKNMLSAIFITMLSSELTVFILSLASGELFRMGAMGYRYLLVYALTGFLGFTLGRTVNYTSIAKAGPSTTSTMISARTIFALVFSIFLTSDILTAVDVAGDLIVTMGIVIVSLDRRAMRAFPPIYMLLPLLASIILGLADVLIRISGVNSNLPIDGTMIAYSVGILSYLPLRGRHMLSMFRSIPAKRLNFLLLAGVTSGLAQIFRYTGLSFAPIFLAVPLISLTPIITVALSYALLGDEKINVKFVIGVIVSIVGVFFLNEGIFIRL